MKYSNKNLKCHKLASQDPVKLVCASPKSSGQALVHYFCQNSTLSNFNNCELSLPLRLPDYVSHSLVKMLSQTKLSVLPLQTKTNRHPNKNQCKIIWLSLFAKQKPFRDHFLWLFSVIIFRDYFFPPTPTTNHAKKCKESCCLIMRVNHMHQYHCKIIWLLYWQAKPVRDYFLLSLQQLVRLLQVCKKLQLFIFWQLTHCHIIFPHAAKYHHIIIYAYSNCIKSPVYCLLLFPVLATSTSPCYLLNILFFFPVAYCHTTLTLLIIGP